MVQKLLILLTAASWLYWLVALILVYHFFRHQVQPQTDYTPPVSILKPVKGIDAQAYQNFVSFCRQEYPEYELLFGVAEAKDPVIPLIERLQREFPQRTIRLVVAPPQSSNRKAGLLHHLEGRAQHSILVVSDSDMRVTPDYLRRVVAPLADRRVGLVTCCYRGKDPLTFTAKLEALHMGATFLPSVLVARQVLAMRFALGATMVVRRRDLARIGGFAAVAGYLADDYQLGTRIAALGLRVHLSNYVIASVLGATTFREQWDREVRWARCTRASRPLEYPGLLLTFSTPLALSLTVVSGFSQGSLLMLLISLLLRWLVAWLVSGWTNNRSIRRWLIWLPVRDLLSALVWCAGGVGRRVSWRGEMYLVRDDGQLEPLVPLGPQPAEEQHHL